MGGSITAGGKQQGFAPTDPVWPDVFGRSLASAFGVQTEVFNAAVGGSTSEDSFYSIESRLPPDLDIVLWEHNYNDYYNEIVWANNRLDLPVQIDHASRWYLCWLYKAMYLYPTAVIGSLYTWNHTIGRQGRQGKDTVCSHPAWCNTGHLHTMQVQYVAHYTLHHTLCTIHHTPYTIHHTPYTIHHTPYTIHHILYSLTTYSLSTLLYYCTIIYSCSTVLSTTTALSYTHALLYSPLLSADPGYGAGCGVGIVRAAATTGAVQCSAAQCSAVCSCTICRPPPSLPQWSTNPTSTPSAISRRAGYSPTRSSRSCSHRRL
jgi:hypothetical protein